MKGVGRFTRTFAHDVKGRARQPLVDKNDSIRLSVYLCLPFLDNLPNLSIEQLPKKSRVYTFPIVLWKRGRNSLSCCALNAGFMTLRWRWCISPMVSNVSLAACVYEKVLTFRPENTRPYREESELSNVSPFRVIVPRLVQNVL